MQENLVDDLVETASCTFLLGESGNAKRTSLAMLDDSHKLNSERNVFEVSSFVSREYVSK